MMGCKVVRTLASVEIEILLILGLSCCLSNSSVRFLESDPYEAIRLTYLVGMDTESKPFEGEAETPDSSYTVAPPTCRVEESEGSSMSGMRSTSSDSTASLSSDQPLTHTIPALVLILCKTACMAMRVLLAMSPGLSAGIAEVAAMSDSTFYKRFRSFYSRRGIKGPTAKDEDLAMGDVGLAAGDEGLGQGSGSAPEPEILERVSLSRQPTLTTWTDSKEGMVYINDPAYPPSAPPAQTLLSPEWLSGSFPISPTPSIVPSSFSSPMISLIVPLPVASHVATSIATILVDKDQFIEKRTVMTFRALWRPVLTLEAWAGRVDTWMIDMSREAYDDHRLVHDMLLQQTALQRVLQETRGRVTALEQERDRRERVRLSQYLCDCLDQMGTPTHDLYSYWSERVKEILKKDKIGSKRNKNGKRGEAEKCQKQLQ
nr:hypothetical protein [Tanacetum cinerariifolium]